MKEDFQKYLCELAGETPKGNIFTDEWKYKKLYILLKAQWAVNRECGKFLIWITDEEVLVVDGYVSLIDSSFERDHVLKSYEIINDNEQEALTKALEYIYDNTK